MSEVFSYRDGGLYLYTGSHTVSGNPVAYVNSINGTLNRQWQSEPAVDGTYRAHVVERRADFSMSLGWMQGETLTTLFEAETALHIKVLNENPGLGSAGIFLYSAVLPSLGFAGANLGVMGQTLNGFAHSWSAF
jgi:hypothetical protein